MNKILKIALAMLTITTLGLLQAIPTTAHTADEPQIQTLYAGQKIDAGVVKIWNDETDLYVQYQTADGWLLESTHLHVASSLAGIPQTKKGNPIPGKFLAKGAYNPLQDSDTFVFSLGDNGWSVDDEIYIAAQADVKKGEMEEGAWAEGNQFPWKNWATYFTYTVQESISEVTVTFDKNGGDTDAIPATATTTSGGTVSLPTTDPTKAGYSFENWNTEPDGSGTTFTASTPVVTDVTVYAQWVISEVTVTFDKNGGDTDAIPTNATTTPGGTVALPTTDPTKAGYSFENWNTESDGSGSNFTASTPVVTDITVYAQWAEIVISEVTVTFDKNGGDTDPIPATANTTPGGTVLLPTTNPTKAGYFFDVWNTESDGSGSNFTSSTPVFADITVYAQWSLIPSPGEDIVVFNDMNPFDLNGMSNPNNQIMVQNIVNYTTSAPRGSGTVVWMDRGRDSRCGGTGECGEIQNATMASNITALGYSVENITSTSGYFTSIPIEVKVIFLFNPLIPYTVDEINTFKQFAQEGGRLVFIGEWDNYYGAGIALENQFLLDMGAVMTNIGSALDCGFHNLGAASLRPHQITTGMTGVRIACASVIVPGPFDYPLFYDSTNTQVLAGVAKIDTTPLP